MSNALLQSLDASWNRRRGDGLPAWFGQQQARALRAAQDSPWPARGAEAWKYTSLHALAQREPVPPPAPVGCDGIEGPGLAFVDGACVAEATAALPDGIELTAWSTLLAAGDERLRFSAGRDDYERDVFDHINAAFAVDGAWLRVAAGVDSPQWLHLDCRGGEHEHDNAWHLGHRIDLGAGSRLRLLVDLGAATTPALATVVSQIHVQSDARLDLVWINAGADALGLIARTRVHVEAGASVRMHVLDTGAAPSRHDLRVALRGEGADARLGGVFLLHGRRHADLQLDLRHEAANATSQTVWRAVANERGRAVFNGKITVAAGADGTDAQLACKSLLGSAQAEADVQPVLEIHADDVKCAHGATVGQLDEQALFYLRSRGIPATQARALLLRAFMAEAFMAIEDSPVTARLSALLGADQD